MFIETLLICLQEANALNFFLLNWNLTHQRRDVLSSNVCQQQSRAIALGYWTIPTCPAWAKLAHMLCHLNLAAILFHRRSTGVWVNCSSNGECQELGLVTFRACLPGWLFQIRNSTPHITAWPLWGNAHPCHSVDATWLWQGGNLQTSIFNFFVVVGRQVKLLEKPNGQSSQQVSYFLVLMLWRGGGGGCLFFLLPIKFSITQSFTTVFITENIKTSRQSKPQSLYLSGTFRFE